MVPPRLARCNSSTNLKAVSYLFVANALLVITFYERKWTLSRIREFYKDYHDIIDIVIVDQSKEERDAKEAKTYLGNVKVVWTNGENVDAAPRDGAGAPPPPKQAPVADAEVDLPF